MWIFLFDNDQDREPATGFRDNPKSRAVHESGLKDVAATADLSPNRTIFPPPVDAKLPLRPAPAQDPPQVVSIFERRMKDSATTTANRSHALCIIKCRSFDTRATTYEAGAELRLVFNLEYLFQPE